MIGAELMRDAALLGARCAIATPADQVPASDEGWAAYPGERAALLRLMHAHEGSADPARLRLCDELGLDLTAYWLVMLCAAAELFPEAAAAVSLIGEDANLQLPTAAAAARLLRGVRGTPYAEALAAVSAGGAAGRLGLVEVTQISPGLPHSQHPLRLASAEIAALHGDPAGLGRNRERRLIRVAPGPQAFSPDLSAQAVRLLTERRVLVLRGPSRRGARQFSCDIASRMGRAATLITVDSDLPGPVELARVQGGVLVLDLHPLAAIPSGPLNQLAAHPGPLMVLVDETVNADGHAVLDSPVIGYPEAARIWAGVLDDAGLPASPPAEPETEPLARPGTEPLAKPDPAGWMAARFRVTTEEAQEAIAEASQMLLPSQKPPTLDQVADRLRRQGARRMGRQVAVLEGQYRLQDLVVPEGLRIQLQEIVAWHRSSHRVRWEMGLGTDDPIGTGLACLLAGKSGTGKTFAARCLAGELGLNLYRIDLSQVVSKYIGETEKALGTVFDEAAAGHGLLLFDEADALFGRRSEVKDAHDRYANIEVGYLLQRLEAYDGIAILTTNLQGNMDGAFLRRLRFILQFPAPDSGLRRQLWERSLPGLQWRADDLQLDLLADRFQLTGGAIHNIGVAAAHLAAATASGRITAEHMLRATQRELHKAGRPTDASIFGPLGAGSPAPRPATGATSMNGARR
jgi:hypothetical protein